MPNPLSLLQLNSLVAETLRLAMPRTYWVAAELSDLRVVRGHCYMQLIEKDQLSRTPTAKADARCWASTWGMLSIHFARVAGQPLAAGMKVMLEVRAQFHPAYGFAWIVEDINPEFTLGDMARRRREIVEQLQAAGIYDLQRELPLPAFAQRVAVVSSDGAAGYGDFCHQLADNPHGFRFQPTLFAAIMQGEQVEQSVIAALDRIAECADEFDVVVIIRGGGATADMSGFDTLALAENVCNFPLPIIIGIGHDRDQSVLDMVAAVSVKTPTAAAVFLADHLAATQRRIEAARDAVARHTTATLTLCRRQTEALVARIPLAAVRAVAAQKERMARLRSRLAGAGMALPARQRTHLAALEGQLRARAAALLTAARHRLQLLTGRTESHDPVRLMQRGYSFATCDGRIVRSRRDVQPGDRLTTHLQDGTVNSTVI